ncbi:SMM1 [Candida pseudojiufengensis]|uniref:SMM1 n=1 Tax=Candida pseudojiufengensis TaxID=497109 RepID=UPI00222451C8|nr:SMM1 [Candida pseudojiufengensis]KAI5966992.1 SMM1 [Candida pseudojiufengensis]
MLDYTNKICLAPMVRSGELPMRLMALKYGCDLVWSPEIIDKKLITTRRVENYELGTIDYLASNNNHQNNKKPSFDTVVFRKHPLETGKLILQLGTSDPDLAVEAALKVIEDVDGIDLNCGCPKSFSTHSGMGAELLKTPDLLCSILRNLVTKVGKVYEKQISCKIRLNSNFKITYNLIEKIVKTGISNLTIHCRTPIMRNRQNVFLNYLPKLIPLIEENGVSLILNGNFQSRSDLKAIQKALGNDKLSIMIAEAAESNPSILSNEPITQDILISEIFEFGQKYHNFPGTKFLIMNMIPGKSKYYQIFAKCKNFEMMSEEISKLKENKENDKDDKIYKILNKNCQKSNSFNKEEFQLEMEKRSNEIENFFENWNEDDMLLDLVDAPTKRTMEIPKHKLETKRQKIEAA